MPATISYSGMERRWLVWPGRGRETLSFTDEVAAFAARDAINAGKALAIAPALSAAQDRTAFLPSRSTKIEGLPPTRGIADIAEVGKRKLTPSRPMPKPELRREHAPPAVQPAAALPKPARRKGWERVQVDLAQAVRLHDGGKGLSAFEIAKRLGTSQATLQAKAAKSGITFTKLNGGNRALTLDLDRAKYVHAVTGSINATADVLKIHAATVSRKFKAAGVKIPSGGTARRAQMMRFNAPRRVVCLIQPNGSWRFVTDDPSIDVVMVAGKARRRLPVTIGLPTEEDTDGLHRVLPAELDTLLTARGETA